MSDHNIALSQPESSPSDKGPIKYETIINQGSYVTGVFQYAAPAGLGQFEIRVSGQPAAVDSFVSEVTILELAIKPVDRLSSIPAADRVPVNQLPSLRKYWQAELDSIKANLDTADQQTLESPDGIWQSRAMSGKSFAFDPKLDLSRDRRIEIEPKGAFEANHDYVMSMHIHPTVNQGARDVYQPVVNNVDFVSARLSALKGDPDLYIYRGADIKGLSVHSANLDDSLQIDDTGGAGQWVLYVKGFTLAVYELHGDWSFRWTAD